MARKRRFCAPLLTYHVISRCINKESLLKPPHVKDLLLQVIIMAQKKYLFDLASYTIMDNHFHFTIRTLTEEHSISRIMQFIKGQFAQRYNRMYNRSGPVWNERFKDIIIEHASHPSWYMLNLLDYQAQNPVVKGYVNNAEDYPYSSIRAYLDETFMSPVAISLHPYFLALGNTFSERAQRYREFARSRQEKQFFIW